MSEKRDQPTHTRELRLGTRARLRAFVLLALTVGGIYVCYLLLLPFLPGLVWALALAILFMPVGFRPNYQNSALRIACSCQISWLGEVAYSSTK